MTEIAGSHIVIIGASGGLGRALAAGLNELGARLTLSCRSRERLDALNIPHAALIPAEVTDPAAFAAVLSAAQSAHGPITGVIYAAGVVAFGPVTEIDDDTIDELALVNLIAPIRLLRDFLPAISPDGFIILLSGVVAERPQPMMATYSAVKAGVAALAAAVTVEARRRQIRVIDVRPPHTETGLATRAIAGQAPQLPPGLAPAAVAARIISAITTGERALPTAAFDL